MGGQKTDANANLFKPLPVFEFRLLQRQDGLLVIFNLFLEVAIFSLCVVNSFQSL